MATTDMHATVEELLEAVLCVCSMLRLYTWKEGQLPLDERLVTAGSRLGGWCVIATSLGGS
jgi:hypothetical protein